MLRDLMFNFDGHASYDLWVQGLHFTCTPSPFVPSGHFQLERVLN